jgi:RNA polymerase sigma-70 factor (ECF subfamily)
MTTNESLVFLTVRGKLVPKTLEAACTVHNQTAGSPDGIAAARALGDLSQKVYAPVVGLGAGPDELLFFDWRDAAKHVTPVTRASPLRPRAGGGIHTTPSRVEKSFDAIPCTRGSEKNVPIPSAVFHESVALAFLAALQLLPPRQRTTLLARDVLGWTAEECAETLGSTVASVNSALQRARQTLEERGAGWRAVMPPEASATRVLLEKYVQAWERSDVAALVSLLHEEATLAMPPLPFWLLGPRDIGESIGAMVLPPGSEGVFRLRLTEANGAPAVAAYARDEDGAHQPRAIHVLGLEGDRVRSITAFLDVRLFARFGLPPSLGT